MLRSVCRKEVLTYVYYALISSKIEYAIEIWGGAYFTNIKPIVLLQKYFIRIISNKNRFEHTLQLFKDLKILPIRNLFVYKVLKNFYDRSGEDRLTSRPQSSRRCFDVSIPKPNSTAFKKSYSYLAPKLFNVMPNEIKSCGNKKKFCKLVRSHLADQEAIESYFSVLI